MTPPDLLLRPSRLAVCWWGGTHALAVLCCAILPWPAALTGAAVLAVHAFWRRPGAPALRCLRVTPDGIALCDEQGNSRIMQLNPATKVTAMLTVLVLHDAGGQQRVVLWADSASPDALRQWRIWLLWCAGRSR